MKYMTQRQFDREYEEILSINKQKEYRRILKNEKKKYSLLNNILTNMKTSNKVLIVAIIAIVSYTITALYIQYNTGIEVSTTLTSLWYGFWCTEILSLAGIKITKVIKNDYKNNYKNTETEYIEYTDIEDVEDNSVG